MAFNCCMHSGEPSALGLHKAADDAYLDSHAGPEGRYARRALRKLPSTMHLADIATCHAGEGVCK